MGGELAAAARALASDFAESAGKIADKAASWFEETGAKALENGHNLANLDEDLGGKLSSTTGELDGAAAPGLAADANPGAATTGGGGGAVPGSVEPPSLNTPASAVGDQGVGPCGKVGEPIDVVGGQLVMQALDVQLGGVLPLVLRRAYASGYRDGRLFGAGWSSTLDIRIVVERDGLRLLDDDARILEYPLPTRPGERVMPFAGERLALEWDRPSDEIRVHHARTGRSWHFTTLGAQRTAAGEVRGLTAISDRNGNRVTVTRDDYGLPTAVDHSGGYRVAIDTVATAAGWRLTALRLRDPDAPGGESVLRAFQYDPRGRLIAVLDETDVPLSFEYDAQDRITAWTDRTGYRFSYTYDELGRVVRTNGDDSYLSGSLVYEPEQSRTYYTDSLGARTEFRYDEHGHVTATVDPLGGTVLTEYDRYGNLISRTDELGHVTRYTLDENGDAVRAQRPDGTVIEAEYDASRNPVRVTGPDRASWSYAYDERGNLSSVTDPLGAQSTYSYDERGRLTAVRDAVGSVTSVRTDQAGLPLEVTDPVGGIWQVRRDARGRVVATTDPLGGATTTVWGPQERPISHTREDGGVATWQYDPAGNLLRHTDAAGNVTQFEPGAFGRVATRVAPDGARYAFAYDSELRLSAVTGPLGATWSYRYDAAGNLVEEQDFNGRTVAYAYDAAGRMIERSNGAGETIALVRDVMGRVIARRAQRATDDNADNADNAADETSLEYDAAGRLTAARNTTDEVLFARDAVGRVTAEIANGLTLSSTYDPAGRQLTRTTPGGRVSTWTYDAAGRPQLLTAGTEQFSFGHDAAGRETYRWFGADAAITSDWDLAGRLTARRVLGVEGPAEARSARILQECSWTYRADGNPVSAADSMAGLRSFDVDPVGRVTAVRAEDWTETYAYDHAGNLVHSSDRHAESSPTAGERAFTGTLLRQAGRTSYEYDAQGRLIRSVRRTLSGARKVWSYAYDAYDRLTDATLPTGERWRYQYDPLGRRTAKLRLGADGAPVEQTRFTWDGPLLAEQTRSATGQHGVESASVESITWDYRPDAWEPLTQDRRTTLADAPQDVIDREFHAIVTDLVGTPVELVTSTGAITWHAQTGLWGQGVQPGYDGCPLRFPGQYHDDETGLDYNLHRYYDPDTARYTTPDPLGLEPSPNQYAYVPNPLTWLDPLGLAGGPPPGGWPAGPISVTEALGLAGDFVGGNSRTVTSGSGGYQFISSETDAAGNTVTRIARLDINPNSPHVQALGPHLNLETQVNGRPVRSGPQADPHIPIDPATIRPGDCP